MGKAGVNRELVSDIRVVRGHDGAATRRCWTLPRLTFGLTASRCFR